MSAPLLASVNTLLKDGRHGSPDESAHNGASDPPDARDKGV